jgi:AcrR family transcriptional regulator
MGYRHQREDMLKAAVELARTEGLGALSFGRVARLVATNDRTVVYYFPTKADLMGNVVLALGTELQELLARAFGEGALPPADLLARSWPVLNSDQAQPLIAIFFEIIGQAAVGRAPFDELAPALLGQWLAWLEPHIDVDDPDRRHADALALLAQLDGLLLIRTVAGQQSASQAARALGIEPD